MDSTPDQKIDVDLLHLKDMRDGISRDADVALKPGISDANGRIFRGLTIAETSQSGELDASRRTLAYAMGQFLGNGNVHLERAQHVINFLDRVLVGALTAELPATPTPSVRTSSGVAAPPPSTPDRFPWLLVVVVVPLAAIVIVAFLWARRRIRAGQ